MIYVLHGENIEASYQHLSALIASYPNHQKVRLTDKNTQEDFYMAVLTRDIFESPKLVISEKLISAKIIKASSLKKIPKDIQVIFWENRQLPQIILSSFKNLAKVENFKPKSDLFWFLDSIAPDPKKALTVLRKGKLDDDTSLVWQLTNRILLLILAKLNVRVNIVEEIIGKKLEEWQWQKIIKQSKLFGVETLKSLYLGLLRVDFIIKTGRTTIATKTLISILLLKYLRG